MATRKTDSTPESLEELNRRAAEAGAAATTAEARNEARGKNAGLTPVTKSTPAD